MMNKFKIGDRCLLNDEAYPPVREGYRDVIITNIDSYFYYFKWVGSPYEWANEREYSAYEDHFEHKKNKIILEIINDL